jgi:hypothetical protein
MFNQALGCHSASGLLGLDPLAGVGTRRVRLRLAGGDYVEPTVILVLYLASFTASISVCAASC